MNFKYVRHDWLCCSWTLIINGVSFYLKCGYLIKWTRLIRQSEEFSLWRISEEAFIAPQRAGLFRSFIFSSSFFSSCGRLPFPANHRPPSNPLHPPLWHQLSLACCLFTASINLLLRSLPPTSIPPHPSTTATLFWSSSLISIFLSTARAFWPIKIAACLSWRTKRHWSVLVVQVQAPRTETKAWFMLLRHRSHAQSVISVNGKEDKWGKSLLNQTTSTS